MIQRNVALVTDSTACIPREQAERYDIEIVPAMLDFGEGPLRDGIEISAKDFYTRLRTTSELPRTYAPPVDAYVKAIVKAGQHASHVFCITPPKGFSSQSDAERHEIASLARQQCDAEITVIAGKTAAAAQCLTVMATARAVVDGLPFDDVFRTYSDVASKIEMYGAIDTLDYLSKSKRVPNLASIASNLLSIKPVFAIRDSEVKTIAYPTSMDGAMHRMTKLMETTLEGTKKNLRVAVMHADDFENALVMKEAVMERFSCLELFITEFTPVMGVHTGPGLVGVAFFQDDATATSNPDTNSSQIR